jgi:hypothetical protein
MGNSSSVEDDIVIEAIKNTEYASQCPNDGCNNIIRIRYTNGAYVGKCSTCDYDYRYDESSCTII